MMLYWALLKFAADNHYPMFDFGRSTPGEGTYSFKKQWGARPSPLHWADFAAAPPTHTRTNSDTGLHPAPLETSLNPAVSQTAATQKRKLAESIIMKMPMPVFKTFGAITRKYISL
jgi:hypothetical protein